MALSYVEIVGINHAGTHQVHCIGSPFIYANLTWVVGSPIAQATLDAEIAAFVPQKITSPAGMLFTVAFADKSIIISNKWLSLDDIISNSTSYVIPWNCKIVGITFSNKNNGASSDIEIYKANVGAGATNTKILTWAISNARTARKTDISIPLVAGDKIGVYVKGVGLLSFNTLIVTLYMQITDGTSTAAAENFSGSF